MPERWILFSIGVVTFTLAAYAGWRVRPQSRWGVVALLSLCLVPVLARAYFLAYPALESQFLTLELYPLLRGWWTVPFTIALFLAAAPHMSSQRARVGLVALGGVFWIIGTDRLLATAVVDVRSMTGVVARDGVCRQTTGYTCGAAVAATLLHHYEIETDEAEMAQLCWTSSHTGTDEYCLVRGLGKKLNGFAREAVIAPASWEALLQARDPVAVTIALRPTVDHWVVVFRATDQWVLIGDPLEGRRLLRADRFRDLWRGRVVEIRRSAIARSKLVDAPRSR